MSGDHHAGAPIADRVRDLEARLIAAGVITDAELDGAIERYLARSTPLNGARLVARAWLDEDFRRLLLDDAAGAAHELGIGPPGDQLRVVANSAERHNVVVCTLCSCYPTRLLGPSPTWYKSAAYRSRVVREPRSVLAEFGFDLPAEVEIAVWDASADLRYMVLPRRPGGSETLDEDGLVSLVTRNGLIGTAPV